MKTIYQTKATALAGRNGKVSSDDGLLAVDLTYPKELGGAGGATNPEQLFAAGYSACFSNAILHVAREAKVSLKSAPVTAVVGIGSNDDGGFALSVSLEAELDLPQEQAIEMVKMAHQVCPYSNAVRGNIEVSVSVNNIQI
ncbi:organic hydroperoxide resistance protein [Vibrio salinus]|uniref:organic hydroperoxide resistance protein n=1 Tax=Vibrio salinus TaxID=2899784 RepID=UPI001E5708C8|nr:organic hydroperoxide resistance protein [Vibrio salinus]MCE0494821.1 organic hydroperoxide resistance protein [Vibrio salinus]